MIVPSHRWATIEGRVQLSISSKLQGSFGVGFGTVSNGQPTNGVFLPLMVHSVEIPLQVFMCIFEFGMVNLIHMSTKSDFKLFHL